MDGQIVTPKPLFDAVKTVLGGLYQEQVNGINGLITAWNAAVAAGQCKGLQLAESFAYILAGVVRETGGRMFPVREGSWHFAGAKAVDWTDAMARNYVRQNHYAYAKEVGGVVYYGRGRIQNTWDFNLKKLAARFNRPELFANPDLLITDWALDAEVTVVGHIEGIWTGHKLAEYFSVGRPADAGNARRIVNGLDHYTEIKGTWNKLLPGVRAAMLPS